MARYTYTPFEVKTPPELAGGAVEKRYPVAIIGAGPIGLAMAIDLAQKGVRSVVLDDNNVVSVGSRAICWAKRSLEIFDRLGVGERMLEKGVTWKIGRLFHGDKEVYNFDLLPETGHKYPAFINLQQYYVEQYLVERAKAFPELINLRFKNKVTGHEDKDDHVVVEISTPAGDYSLDADYLLACDGANSPTRSRMGLSFTGETFEEQFLIVDVEMPRSPFNTETAERWFWFDPVFHNGQSALLHKQPDDIYRIDLQLGPDADAETEKREENVLPRIRAVVGDTPFTIDWVSVYKFRCARLDRFVHGRVIFVGDSAHVVSPFGARGGNGGIHDVDNLGWKLAAVLKKEAPRELIETYNAERVFGADENIRNSARATNFMTPKSPMEGVFRSEVLALAEDLPFARRLINSGRLSVPASLAGFPLQSPSPAAPLPPGSALVDAPLSAEGGDCYLSDLLDGDFCLISFGETQSGSASGIRHLHVADEGSAGDTRYIDKDGLALERYGTGLTYLFRPDAHIAAVFERPSAEAVRSARDRALGATVRQAAE